MKDNNIRKELLKYTKEYDKVYFMTLLKNIAKDSNTNESEVMEFVQTSFLKSDADFRYYLTKTRRGVKIAAIKKFEIDPVAIEFQLDNESNESLVCYMLSQFLGKVSEIKIRQITKFYKSLSDYLNIDENNNIIYIAIDTKSKNIYTQLSHYNRDEIDELIELIKEHGYAFERDGILYWKTHSPNADITSEDLNESFSVMNTNKEIIKEIPEDITIEELPAVTKPLTAKTAINFLAKEFGMTISEDDSKHRLEELVATTNELILNFDSLQDWEKLKSWEQFVKDWQSIMGEAMNDRN